MATYCVNIASGNGLLSDGSKPLPEPVSDSYFTRDTSAINDKI